MSSTRAVSRQQPALGNQTAVAQLPADAPSLPFQRAGGAVASSRTAFHVRRAYTIVVHTSLSEYEPSSSRTPIPWLGQRPVHRRPFPWNSRAARSPGGVEPFGIVAGHPS